MGEDDKIRPSNDEEEIDATAMEEAKKQNQHALMYLMMAFTSESVMGMVYKSWTAALPGCLVRLVVVSLSNEEVLPHQCNLMH